ncbi:MAG: hypothetical protein JWM91_688, partial [Rhodospirillales bacterium]|nr:hypothetical protein [Rhodospirillales bacterium]
MTDRAKPANIGLGGAYQLCNMSSKDRLAFIAEGLPIIFESAKSLVNAAEKLIDHPRERAVLKGHAEEEAAKILILIDVLRCPPKIVSGRIGLMIKWFYDHLARMIYANAQSWQAWRLDELQG